MGLVWNGVFWGFWCWIDDAIEVGLDRGGSPDLFKLAQFLHFACCIGRVSVELNCSMHMQLQVLRYKEGGSP
jgi:hypothetical protein